MSASFIEVSAQALPPGGAIGRTDRLWQGASALPGLLETGPLGRAAQLLPWRVLSDTFHLGRRIGGLTAWTMGTTGALPRESRAGLS